MYLVCSISGITKGYLIKGFPAALLCSASLHRTDMQQFGIKVSIIEPGFFKTNLTNLDVLEADLRRLWSRLPQEDKDSYGDTYFDDCEWKNSC